MRNLGLVLFLTIGMGKADGGGGIALPLPLPQAVPQVEAEPSSAPPVSEVTTEKTAEERVEHEPKKGPDAYDKLTLRDGSVFEKCRVIRADPDALLVEHSRGMARLSLFELPASVQEEWGFDPFKATEYFKAETARQRELRWRMFWERQQYESEQAQQEDEQRLMATAAREWVPVEATVLKRLEGGSMVASCKRVTFKKTKTKSTLGFEIDGPPKRVLVPFGDGPIVLRIAVSADSGEKSGSVWKGYVHPISEGQISYRSRGQSFTAPAHAATPAEP